MIAHVDLGSFFIAVERARKPELIGRAVVIGGRPESGGVVAAASREARRTGVRPGMLLAQASVVPAVNQIEVHPYFQQKTLQRLHAEHRILTQAWSPIGGITSYRGGEKRTFDDPALQVIAREHGKSTAQVMLRWHLQEGRSAIPKSTKPARIAENVDVFDFELSSDQITAIGALDTGVGGGPEPDAITLETFGRQIPEA